MKATITLEGSPSTLNQSQMQRIRRVANVLRGEDFNVDIVFTADDDFTAKLADADAEQVKHSITKTSYMRQGYAGHNW